MIAFIVQMNKSGLFEFNDRFPEIFAGMKCNGRFILTEDYHCLSENCGKPERFFLEVIVKIW